MRNLLLSGAFALLSAQPVLAQPITVTDAYALSASPQTGAAFMLIANAGGADRLVSASTPAAARAELHTHIMENGVAKMREVEGGIELPASAEVRLERGGLHVMLMSLTQPLKEGDSVPLTLTFASGAVVELVVPVKALAKAGGTMEHKHGTTP